LQNNSVPSFLSDNFDFISISFNAFSIIVFLFPAILAFNLKSFNLFIATKIPTNTETKINKTPIQNVNFCVQLNIMLEGFIKSNTYRIKAIESAIIKLLIKLSYAIL